MDYVIVLPPESLKAYVFIGIETYSDHKCASLAYNTPVRKLSEGLLECLIYHLGILPLELGLPSL